MGGQIAVSISCTAYNQEKYIRDALEGFVNQKTEFAFEVLVHDDASTDGTADIIKEYEKKYPEIIKPVYQFENQYSKHNGSIRKIQADRAKGKYIAFCEGDDYWTDPLKLQKQYDFMEAHPEYTLCACSAAWLNMLNGKIEKYGSVKNDMDIPLEDIILEKNGRIFVTVSVFCKTEIWKNRPLWGFPIGDYPLAVYAGLNGRVHMLADVMCVYRWHSSGSWTERMDNAERRVGASRKMIEALNTLNKDTSYRYDNVISQRIKKQEYIIALQRGDWAAIKSDELVGIFRKKDFLHRISDFLRCKTPKMHRHLKTVFTRVLGIF